MNLNPKEDTNLFRKVALERLSSPDHLDRLMQVTTPRGWIALIMVGIVLAALIVWSFVGYIRTAVEGRGMLISEQTPVEDLISIVEVPTEGKVTALRVSVDDVVAAGQPLAQIEVQADATTQQVTSPISGRVIAIQMAVGDLAPAGVPLLTLMKTDFSDLPLAGVIYVSFADAQSIRPGMEVEVSPITIIAQEYGFIQGEVISVGEFPALNEIAHSFATGDDPVIEVHIKLRIDDTPTGYQWSFAECPTAALHPNTICTAKIIIEKEHPIARVLPVLGD